jgi:ArsR family transcriptional regulator
MKRAEEFTDCAERLKALADPDRLRIVDCLFSGEKHVSEIAEALDEEIVKVSHHLGILRRAKILKATKKGRFVVYSVHPDVRQKSSGAKLLPHIDLGCCSVNLG